MSEKKEISQASSKKTLQEVAPKEANLSKLNIKPSLATKYLSVGKKIDRPKRQFNRAKAEGKLEMHFARKSDVLKSVVLIGWIFR